MPASLRKKLKQDEFYCVSCRARVKGDDICVDVLKNRRVKGGVPTLAGYCKRCGTNVYKFVKRSAKDRLVDKYGRC